MRTTAGGVCKRPVSLQALFKTLTALAGLPEKEGTGGNNLIPLLKDPTASWPHAAITTTGYPGRYAISQEDWRYIHYEKGGEELYHIAEDPYEWTNLAAKPEHAAKLKEFRTLAPKDPVPLVKTGK